MRPRSLLFVCLLLPTLSGRLEATTSIVLHVKFDGIHSLNPQMGEGEAKLAEYLATILETDYPVYDWNPQSTGGTVVLKLTFIVEPDTKEMFGKFAIDSKPRLDLPGDDGPLIRLGNRSAIGAFAHRPVEVADYFHEKFKVPLARLASKWKDFLCKEIPVARGPAKNLHVPPDMQVHFPFTHPSYLQNWFNVKGFMGGQGEVLLEVEGLKAVVQSHLTARIETWMLGKQKIAPPANVARYLNALEQVRVHLQSMEPRVDPQYASAKTP